MNFEALLLTVLAQDIDPAGNDYIRESVESALAAINGGPGDVFVGVTILGMLLFIWKKRYRAAAGCLVLICGIVILRIAISIFFGVEAF